MVTAFPVACQVAAHYGVRPTFAALAFLRWAAEPARLTPTADCLSMLAQELRPLKRAEASLLPEVRVLLLCLGVSELCFASYQHRDMVPVLAACRRRCPF